MSQKARFSFSAPSWVFSSSGSKSDSYAYALLVTGERALWRLRSALLSLGLSGSYVATAEPLLERSIDSEATGKECAVSWFSQLPASR